MEDWKREDEPFHEIHSFPNILDKIQSQPITTIIGSPGSGKTTTARHLALRLQTNNEFEIIPIDEISEIKQYGHLSCKQLFILDDVFGIFGFEYEKLTNLERYKDTIFNVLGDFSKILFTCRIAVYNEASNLKSFVLKREFIFDLEDNNNRLNVEDRKQILNNHCKQNDISLGPDELSNFSSTAGSIMYPLVCKQFCSESKYRALGKEFFENPYSCIHKEMDYLQGHKRIHYASLVTCMFCENEITESMMRKKDSKFEKIKEKVLENCSVSGRNSEIKDALDNMLNTFTIRTNEGYSLIHDAVYEVLASHYGNNHQEDMLEYMSSSFVANKFIVNGISDDIGDLHIKIHEKHYRAFAERIVEDMKNFKLRDVFMNKALKSQCICNALIDELKKLSYFEIKKLFFHKNPNYAKYLRNIQSNSRYLLIRIWENYSARAISWVIFYGHRLLLRFLFDQVTEHQESIRRVMELEIRRENGDGFISNLQEQSRLLSLSCHSGDVEVVQLLLKHCDVECFDGSFNSERTSPLAAACGVWHMPMVKEYIIRHEYSFGLEGDTTPIHEASGAGHVNVVDFLIKCGAHCNQSDKRGRTPIHRASGAGHVDVVDFLIKCGADCTQSDNNGSTPINEASTYGSVDIVDLLIKGGADCNQSDKYGTTPIHQASLLGFVDVVDLLIKGGADCNHSDRDGSTPIHYASGEGHVNVVDLLIKGGADCKQSDKHGMTPIHEASKFGYVDVVDLLIKGGAHCNLSDRRGMTPIHKSSGYGHVDVVDFLVKCGADCNKSDKHGRTPIQRASFFGHVGVVDLLIKGGGDCNKSDKRGRTLIYDASGRGHVNVVDFLIKGGADCNQSDKQGRTPIHRASKSGHFNVVDLLIKGGADCNQSDKRGITPIHEATEEGHANVVDFLIRCGADCNQSDKQGRTLLHKASNSGYVDTVNLLIKCGADCNQSDKRGRTPIYVASLFGHVGVVGLLIKCGVDCNQSDKQDMTPIHKSSKYGHVDVVDLLLKGGADCNQSDCRGRTPLHEASKAGHVDVVVLLIKGGADCNQRDKVGRTPIYIASLFGHVDVVDLLIKDGADCNQSDKDGKTPLHIASEAGRVNVLDHLIKGGADYNQSE